MCRLLLCVLLLTCAGSLFAQQKADLKEKNNINILLVHGFNPTLPWSQDFIQGVAKGTKNAEQQVNVFVESVYSEYSEDAIDFKTVADSLIVKYKNIQIDVIVGDNIHSSEFVEYLRTSGLFEGAKLAVFDPIKVYDPQSTEIISPYQIFNAANIKLQVENVFAMVPAPSRIILSRSKENLFIHHYNEIKKYRDEHLPNVQIELWGLDKPEVFEQRTELTPQDLFFYFPVFYDVDGTNIPPKLFLRKFATDLKSPIFSFYSTFMGEGIVGGLVYDAAVQGESAISFALASLGFASLQQDFPTAIWMYDYAQVKRFDLTILQDKDDVIIINPPSSILNEYPLHLAGLIMLFGLLLFLLFLYKNRKLNRAYEELEIAHAVVEKTANQAIEASNAKSKFLAIVSHEIRTPINGLMGVLEMLQHTKLESNQTKLLNMGIYSSESLLRTVNDILDFSKLNLKKFTLDASVFSPRELMNEVFQYAEVIAGASGLKVKVDLTRLVDVPLLGDKSRIKQIFDNLINNAVKFTSYGSISINARVIRTGQFGHKL
ncbi:two-component system sensor-response regulator hybrid protein [Glaciecola sp. KUL10]|nr:two-component system sensor-response regulator hybrid protein [Glaciecola sp. KUL10]